MAEPTPSEKHDRFGIVTTLGIALVSLLAALVLWRAAIVGSSAADADRRGIIDTVRSRSSYAQNLELLYQEARIAVNYRLDRLRIDKLNQAAQLWKEQNQPGLAASAAAEAQWLDMATSGMAQVSPLATDDSYKRADGSLDLQRRLEEIAAQNPDLRDLKPEDSFQQAGQRYRHVQLLFLAETPLALVFVCCTLAQLIERRVRYAVFGLGAVLFFLTLGFLALLETGLIV